MGADDTDKIIRIPGETLLVELSSEEIQYRNKYLPDPKKLTDEKLVCTVCSVSLAQNIHKGKDVFVHRALNVLVCEACYNFYGDGCFSVDEDGDDKYCRWCGQGGTLYLCSTCTCAFCQKCVKQNLKPSVLSDLENDDWKCYICNPRPLFGCRTICWGAEELNKIGKEKEKEKLKKQKERLEKIEEDKKKKDENGRKPRKVSTSEDDRLSKKRKARGSDSDSTSPEVMPTKRSKRESRTLSDTRNLNGSLNKSRRRRKDSSSENEISEDNKRPSRTSKTPIKSRTKSVGSSSDSDTKSKIKSKKKKQRDTSEESSDEDKRKSKRKSLKKKEDSSDDSSDGKSKKKKRFSKKKKDVSDSSSDEKQTKKKVKKKKKETSDEDWSDDEERKKPKKTFKKKVDSSDNESDKRDKKKTKDKKALEIESKKKNDIQDSDNEPSKRKKADDAEEELKLKLVSKDNSAENALIKKRIKLSILWLNSAVKDISQLGSLISVRATKFCKKKINQENLKSYEDVLNTVSKLKQLINGIHSNYEHIEKSLDAQFKPWKILTGLEEPDNDKTIDGAVTVTIDEDLSSSVVNKSEPNDVVELPITKDDENSAAINPVNNKVEENNMDEENKEKEPATTEKNDDINLQWSGLSADENSDSEEKNATKAMISKADETLSRDEEKEEHQLDSSDKGETVKENSGTNPDPSMLEDSQEENETEKGKKDTLQDDSVPESQNGSETNPDEVKSDSEDEKDSKKSPKKSKVENPESKTKTPVKKSSRESSKAKSESPGQ